MEKVTAVLEGLRAEERRLADELSGVRRAIAALEAAIGNATEPGPVATPEPSAPPPAAGAPAPVAPGPYAKTSLYEAVATYLSGAGEPKTVREIAEALLAGGYPTRAKDFTATVRTMLLRGLSAQAFGIYRAKNGGRWFVGERFSEG